MELTFEQYDKIQKYLDGNMSPAGEKALLEELDSNKTMQEHLAFEKELREQLFIMQMEKDFPGNDIHSNEESAGDEAGSMKKQVEEAGNNWKQKQNKNPLRPVRDTESDRKVVAMPAPGKRLWYMVAAACGIIAIAGIAIWQTSGPGTGGPVVVTDDTLNKKPTIIIKDPGDTAGHREKVLPGKDIGNYASIVKKYYKKDEAPFPEDIPQYLRKPFKEYNDDNYSSITKTEVNDPPVGRDDENEIQTIKELGHYYKGLAFIETKENSKAIDNLSWVIDSAANETLRVKGRWYRGLAYLKSGNPVPARKDFTSLAGNNNAVPYNRQSSEILNSLK